MQSLAIGSTLQDGKYRIEKVLGQGGFGISYLAEHELLGTKVAIKEFFFKQYCEREEATSHVSIATTCNLDEVKRYEEKFLKEARVIARLNHPNIVKVHDIFKENNTSYYVMDYIEGETLSDIVKRRGALPESEAVEYIRQAGSALQYIHEQKLNHLDVKPANLMLRAADQKVILIDFGLSKQYDAVSGNQTSTTPVGISHGYAAIEMYKEGGVREFSPQTDIYALGATLYKLLTGNTPPQASDIIEAGLPEMDKGISEPVRKAITQAMEIRKVNRPQSINAFLDILLEGNEKEPQQPNEEDKIKKERKAALEKEVAMLSESLESVQKHKEELQNKQGELEKQLKDIEAELLTNTEKASTLITAINNKKWELQELDNPSLTAPQPKTPSKPRILTKEEKIGSIYTADYTNLPIDETEAMDVIIKKLLKMGKYPAAGKYYMDQTGLDVEDAIEYLDFLKEQNEETVVEQEPDDPNWVDLGLSVKWAVNNYGNSNYYPVNAIAFENFEIYEDLPTANEFQELIDKCNWKWNNNGYTIVGPTGKSIFLPADGWEDPSGAKLYKNTFGQYWAKEKSSNSDKPLLHFDKSEKCVTSGFQQYKLPVRLVLRK